MFSTHQRGGLPATAADFADTSDADLFAAGGRAFPDASHLAVSSWCAVGNECREWCLWTSADGQRWRIVARGWSRRELLVRVHGLAASVPLRVVQGGPDCSKNAAHSQRRSSAEPA